MLNRRHLMTTAAAALSAAVPALKAQAKEAEAKGLAFDVEARGTTEIFERLPRLDLESELDFYTGYRTWVRNDVFKQAARRAEAIFKARGLDPNKNDLPVREVVQLLEADPILAYNVHARETTQQIMWKAIQDEYHAHADQYLDELDRAAKQGPGTLQVRKDLHIPKFASYEIHLQPGGYVGDAFAGYIYYHGLNVEFADGNYHDELQGNRAATVPVPADGKVRRVLDQGCSSGQLVQQLKKRFPEAEAWGNDIGAPMLRFAHMRSVDLGVETHYAHELCEQSQFPDNHFDIITNFLLYHEVPEAIGRAIIHEAWRTLRPGGIWYPMDIYTTGNPPTSAYSKFSSWYNHRWNAEVWWLEYYDWANDF
ncbi:MAG: class I SAM-dependent methyltransferase, partial [Rhodospirillaceae bacterium]|nr:class I SAM-dependent methyltransferase [Rhodospirillaceae bacterium]